METNDYLNFSNDRIIATSTKNETLLFSDKIIKINRFNSNQERNIVITDQAIYNLKKKELKRRFPLNKLLGITISKLTDEMILHGIDTEYDYYYISSKRNRIVEIIAEAHKLLMKENLHIYVLNLKNIKEHVTLKKEKEKNPKVSKMPIEGAINLKDFKIMVRNINLLGKRNSQIVKRIYYVQDKTVKDVKLEDFQIVSVLGRGSFGKVCLVEYKNTGELYAMKSIKKDVMIDQEQIENTLTEKKILQTINHPFICSLVFCFQTEDRVFFVLNYVKGGELFNHLRKQKRFSEERAKFYLVQIGLALQYLHDNNIVYRDLKPENILVDESGYIKLADFGLAKSLAKNEKSNSICGTPEYVAPEILFESGHDYSVDWWGFGILFYEMIMSFPPFYNENIEAMYDQIKYTNVKFPSKHIISPEAKDLITKLLTKSPKSRMGSNYGFKEIFEHEFFTGVDLEKIIKKETEAEFKPEINGNLDLQNFDKEMTSQTIQMTKISDGGLSLINKNQYLFGQFNK